MLDTHLHYIIWGFERNDLVTGQVYDMATIDVIAPDEKAALEKAQRLVKKSGYFVKSVVEHISGQPCS